ncbi:MAG TPA: hypothetical protein VGL05_02740, partial [Kribbella sp.]
MSSVAQATATGTLCPAQQVATLPGMARVDIDGVAPGGRFQVGAATRADGTGATVLWDNGVPQLVATGHENSWGVDVDDGGQAVLVTSDGDATARWRYRNGALEELPTPAGYFNPTVKAIDNDRGDILGTVSDADGWNVRAVVWNSANQPRVLPVPAGYNEVQVGDIDDGTVVGTVLDFDIPNARTRAMKPAYWFTDGRAATIPASAPEAFAQADAIRNGIVAGVDAGQVTTWQVG